MTGAPPRLSRRVAVVTIAALALAASVTSLRNGFTYDDVHIVLGNSHVHSVRALWRLFAQPYWPMSLGGGLYRPVVMIAFALEWTLGHGAPIMFHAVNVALYVGVSVLVYFLADALLPRSAAWVAAALFAVHPVHVEAVGNVVGQSELLAAAALVGAVLVYVRARRGPDLRIRPIAALGLLYALGCFAKEHAVLLIPLLVATELLVVDDQRPWRVRLRALVPLALTLASIAGAYLIIRSAVPGVRTGDASSAVLRGVPWSTRVLVLLEIAGDWGRLLLWPLHLSADYAPRQISVPDSWGWTLLPGAITIAGAVALIPLLARRARVAALGLAWTCITLALVSGILVPTGVLLAERTLFAPSIGVALTVGAATAWFAERYRRRARLIAVPALAALVVAGMWRSAVRQAVWRDDYTLWATTVRDAPESYHAHWMRARQLLARDRLAEGEHEYRAALALFPWDPGPADELGSLYASRGLCGPARPLFEQALRLAPWRTGTRARLDACGSPS